MLDGADRRGYRVAMRCIALLAAVALLGCDRDRPAPPAPPASPAASPAATYSEHTGVLSEEAFRKLHQLSADAAPPRKGQAVELDGGRAYLSLPPGAQPPLPALVVIHEWWGLNEHIEHWADRLAADGYAALAVDLFGGKVATTPERAMELMKGVEADRARQTLLAAHDFLEKDARVRASRTGSIGWCFGGKWSLELALAEPDLDAAVVYYGHVTTDVDRLKQIQAPVLALFGDKDASIPPERVAELEKALERANVRHRVLSYDAEHAFANPSGARYDEGAAAAAWTQTREFLQKELKRP